MDRRRFLLLPLAVPALRGVAASAAVGAAETPMAPVVPGRLLRFPDDEGSHPQFRIEWWYATGWLFDDARRALGFQITFFRNRRVDTGGNPSRFAPAQLFVAHAALAATQRGRLLHDQRIARGGFGLAEAAIGVTDVKLDGWLLRAGGDRLQATVAGREFGFDLSLRRTQPPLLHGEQGFSRKGPAPDAASYYYSLPHLAVTGSIRITGKTTRVTGSAWLDHEWSSKPMDPAAEGWDWIGINLDDGSSLMVLRMRGKAGAAVWSAATLRTAGGHTTTFAPEQVRWDPLREWRSPRTAASYPIAWRVQVGERIVELEPLFDDQENDARASSGTVYWEGAVTARTAGRVVGRGYLELTGYWRALRL